MRFSQFSNSEHFHEVGGKKPRGWLEGEASCTWAKVENLNSFTKFVKLSDLQRKTDSFAK